MNRNQNKFNHEWSFWIIDSMIYTFNPRREGRTFPRDVRRADPEGHPEKKSGLNIFHYFSVILSQVWQVNPFSLPAPENRSILINEQLTSILIPQICSSELLYWRLSFWTWKSKVLYWSMSFWNWETF